MIRQAILCTLLLAGCWSPPLLLASCAKVSASPPATGAAPATSQSNPTASNKTISDEVGFLLVGLIVDSRQRPTLNAIDTYAAAFHWTKNPPEFNTLVNAKSGYHGTINGQRVVLGGDGTNDIFSVMINHGFEPAHVVAAMRQAFTLKLADTEEDTGQRSDSYYLLEHDKVIGVVFMTYGVADAIRGTGSVGFMSMKKAREATGK